MVCARLITKRTPAKTVIKEIVIIIIIIIIIIIFNICVAHFLSVTPWFFFFVINYIFLNFFFSNPIPYARSPSWFYSKPQYYVCLQIECNKTLWESILRLRGCGLIVNSEE